MRLRGLYASCCSHTCSIFLYGCLRVSLKRASGLQRVNGKARPKGQLQADMSAHDCLHPRLLSIALPFSGTSPLPSTWHNVMRDHLPRAHGSNLAGTLIWCFLRALEPCVPPPLPSALTDPRPACYSCGSSPPSLLYPTAPSHLLPPPCSAGPHPPSSSASTPRASPPPASCSSASPRPSLPNKSHGTSSSPLRPCRPPRRWAGRSPSWGWISSRSARTCGARRARRRCRGSRRAALCGPGRRCSS